jgi:hypothetical protein
MSEGPFKSVFEADTAGVLRREIVTYRLLNGVMIRETTVRDYYKNGDYHDSQTTLPLRVK